jgi:hypothetical protein
MEKNDLKLALTLNKKQMNNLTKRQYLLISIALFLLIAVIFRTLPFLSGNSDSANDIDFQSEQISKYYRLAAEKEVAQKKLISLNQQITKAENRLLVGKTPALAAVSLQNTLSSIAKGCEVTINSQLVRKPTKPAKEEQPPYLEIPVQIAMTITIRQLKNMLHGIAAATTFLKVSEATVKVSVRDNLSLQTVLTVSGLMTNSSLAD